MRDPSGIGRRSGFVAFSTPDEAKLVVNKPLCVALAQRKEESRAMLQAQFSQIRPFPMPSAVAPRMPMYPPSAPGFGQQIFYGQATPMIPPQVGFGYQHPQQQLSSFPLFNLEDKVQLPSNLIKGAQNCNVFLRAHKKLGSTLGEAKSCLLVILRPCRGLISNISFLISSLGKFRIVSLLILWLMLMGRNTDSSCSTARFKFCYYYKLYATLKFSNICMLGSANVKRPF
ncbi:hypothetical protein Nepgr_002052 [Nepenthes gracilis]|uniref:RRM domain-containing protein n=1 Tax=Nepenthes gracilis TaxID=150966 RepID=A0AAD3RY22_NEPGR|nr:hypothetical protein Nepgr_002052 [Nepenthes gracilis]